MVIPCRRRKREPRSVTSGVRFSASEYALVEQAAAAAGADSISDYLRTAALATARAVTTRDDLILDAVLTAKTFLVEGLGRVLQGIALDADQFRAFLRMTEDEVARARAQLPHAPKEERNDDAPPA